MGVEVHFAGVFWEESGAELLANSLEGGVRVSKRVQSANKPRKLGAKSRLQRR
jgi:hypothetical protein